MPKLKQNTIIPTDEEDAEIYVGIATDPDTYELTDAEFAKLKPGRPVAEVKKDRITIRLSPEVTGYFRATGKGWQTRLDKVLLEYIAKHQ